MQSVLLAAVKLLTGRPDEALMNPEIAHTIRSGAGDDLDRLTPHACSGRAIGRMA
jgi:hypothetical protein